MDNFPTNHINFPLINRKYQYLHCYVEELSRDEGFPNKNEDDVQKWMVKYLQFKCTL